MTKQDLLNALQSYIERTERSIRAEEKKMREGGEVVDLEPVRVDLYLSKAAYKIVFDNINASSKG